MTKCTTLLTKVTLNRLEGILKFSKVSLVIVLLITLFLGFQIKDLKFDYDFEAFFPPDDPETQYFEEHRKRFESDNDFIFIVARNEPTVFNHVFLKKVDAFADSIAKDTLVRGVQCLTNMEDYLKTPFSPMVFKTPYINLEENSDLSKDSARIFNRAELKGFFINEKADGILIYIKHQQFLSKKKCDLLKSHIDELLAHFELTDFKYAGRTIGLGYYIDKMQNETLLFIGLSFILVIAFLIFTFKSLWGVWVPLTIVTLSMIWIVGFMSMIGQPMNLVLTVLPSIIFVVAMSDVIHLVSKYMDEIRLGKNKYDAVKTAYREVGLATLMTSVTTAIGFITLITVSMQPVKEFGIYTALGVMLAYVLTYTVLPGLLIYTKAPKISDKTTTETTWYIILHKLFRYLIRRRKFVFGLSILVVTLSVCGTLLVKADYYLLEDLSKKSSLRQDYDYFDKEFMGLRPFEMAVEVKNPERSVLDYQVLKEIDKVETYLTQNYGIKQCFSVVNILKIANRSEHSGQVDYFVLPDSASCVKYIAQLQTFDKSNVLASFVDSTEKFARISSTMGDVGMYEIRKRDKALHKFMTENINTNLVEFKSTGTAHLLDLNMSSLSLNMMYGLLISCCLIGLIMGFLYRSVKMVLIALSVNILPLLMIGALLGFAGIDMKVSTAIIFTISFGIAVDDTLHFMSRFRLELAKGRTHLYALKRTFLSTGKAIVLTSVILCAGFLLLLFSDFLGTFYVGLLISLTLIFALMADLFLLPVLLMIFHKKK